MYASLIPIARLDALSDDTPAHAEADGIDFVLVRRGAAVHVFEGRCPHRGALLADGRVEGAPRDLTSWKREVADLVGVRFAGVDR